MFRRHGGWNHDPPREVKCGTYACYLIQKRFEELEIGRLSRKYQWNCKDSYKRMNITGIREGNITPERGERETEGGKERKIEMRWLCEDAILLKVKEAGGL